LDNKSAFQLIQNYLNVSNEQVNVAMFNLSHISTKLHTNLVLKKSRVLIAKNDFHGETLAKNYTMELVGDLKSAKVDSKRSLDTWKKENPKKGHCLDSWRYFISTNCSHISKVLELEK
jgi:viroplasmin and RNaseH domain-containing protein